MSPSRQGEKGGLCRCLLKVRKKANKNYDLTTNNCQFHVTESSSVGKCLDFLRLLSTTGNLLFSFFIFLVGCHETSGH